MTPPPSTEGLIERLKRLLPVSWDNEVERRGEPTHAVLTFGEHQTQAITMCPDDWMVLNEIADLLEARTPPTPEGPPDDVLMAVRALLDKHIEQCRVAMNESETWAASTPSEWERARDALLSFGDDLEALARTFKTTVPDDELVERLRELRMQRAEIFDCGGDDVDVALGDAIEALARFTQPKEQ